MKKLMLMTAAAALITAPAIAAERYVPYQKPIKNSYSTLHPDAQGNLVEYTTVVTTVPGYEKNVPLNSVDLSGTYPLVDGNNLIVKGETAYLMEPDGYRYFAPSGAYQTVQGEVFQAESGKILRMESPQVVAMDMDMNKVTKMK